MKGTRRFAGAMVVALLSLAACGGGDDDGETATRDEGGGTTTVAKLSQPDLVAKVSPSVVSIVGRSGDDFNGGSGVIFNAERGLILTNAHVVAGLSALKVFVNNGKYEAAGRVVAQAPCSDLAVVSVDRKPPEFPALPFGDSRSVRPGDHVTALGFPASFQEGAKQKVTATEGSVSVTDIPAEPDASLPKYESVIQHQAPINPGNSGGALVNDQGQLIGLNTLRNTITGGGAPIQGQSYAISVNLIKEELPDLEAGRNSAYVGWDLVPNNDEVASVLESIFEASVPTSRGLVVVNVDSGSEAEAAKLVSGDIITEIEGVSVESVQDVCDILLSKNPGATISVGGFDRLDDYEGYSGLAVKIPA